MKSVRPSIPCLGLLPVVFSASLLSGQTADEPEARLNLVFDGGRTQSYGQIYQFETVESVFTFTNHGTSPVEILGVEFALLGGEATWDPAVVAPGERGTVRIAQPVGAKLGAFTLRHSLRSTDPRSPRLKLSSTGFIQSAFEPEVGRIDLGAVDRRAGTRGVFELTTRETAALSSVRAVRSPEWLVVTPRAAANGQTAQVEVAVAPGAPLGFHVETVELATGLPQQPVYLLEVRATVHSSVRPHANPVQLGVLRQFESFEKQVTLRHQDGGSVVVERVEGAEPFEVTETACPHPAGQQPDPACRMLVLRGRPQERGSVDGSLRVYLQGSPEPIPIRLVGTIAGPGTVIQNLGELELGTVIHSDGRIERLAEGVMPAPLPTVASGGSAPAEGEPQPSPAGGNSAEGSERPEAKLVWRVRRENQAFGFLIYRSEDRSGPFVRVNPAIVEAEGKPHKITRYEFVDRQVEPGRTYFYYIDTISKSGLKQRLTGVTSKTVAPDAAG